MVDSVGTAFLALLCNIVCTGVHCSSTCNILTAVQERIAAAHIIVLTAVQECIAAAHVTLSVLLYRSTLQQRI